MNVLLLEPHQHYRNDLYLVHARQAEHIRRVLGLTVGDSLRAGLLNGPLGRAEVTVDDGTSLQIRFTPTGAPPPPPALKLVLALPRPKMLKRLLIDATSLGIKELHLINSYKVEKSFWSTPELKSELLHSKLLLGLEQSGDTQLPQLHLARRFKPFVEDILPGVIAGHRALLAHPGEAPPLPASVSDPICLAIGPEGGWTAYEVNALQDCGFAVHSFGPRILRVETALPALVGRLLPI
ncbi:16S rRNA (uracil(1498)-N(3))-methyltransferase [Isoalcanivorax beigongshangi]|uniref:Ribosomal RNA small subunit methyltransferase E n=1 Tax=Isoalcanivorax beigongshangi TaxID=3238810 RepID=A0ABV4AH35_9GAMM